MELSTNLFFATLFCDRVDLSILGWWVAWYWGPELGPSYSSRASFKLCSFSQFVGLPGFFGCWVVGLLGWVGWALPGRPLRFAGPRRRVPCRPGPPTWCARGGASSGLSRRAATCREGGWGCTTPRAGAELREVTPPREQAPQGGPRVFWVDLAKKYNQAQYNQARGGASGHCCVKETTT